MRIYYKKPVILEDGKILLEQVTELAEDITPNGISRKESSVITEIYPSRKLFEQTIRLASENYKKLELQKHKTVGQLDAEQKALKELINMYQNL